MVKRSHTILKTTSFPLIPGRVAGLYDGDANRVAKAANGVTTRYLVDDLNPNKYAQVVEESVNGTVQRTYTYGLQRIDENQVINSAWAPSFYGYDGMGNVRQLTNSAGATTDSYEYDAFGNEITHTGTTPNNYLYRGDQWDADLDLYHLRARYYNPATGRFMSRDPNAGQAGVPASLHKYLYANGDPVDGLDPTGRDDLEEYRPLCCAEENAFQKTVEEINCSYEQIGAALFGTLVHQYFRCCPCEPKQEPHAATGS